jgi:hypothetical protein
MSNTRGGRQNGKGMKVADGMDLVVGASRRGHHLGDKGDLTRADILAL